MEKMKMESSNLTSKNIEKIAEIFPNCLTETMDDSGALKKAINFNLLQQMLCDEVVQGDEAYEFTWVGKKAAVVEANRPVLKTLRPCPDESVNWDATENIYIEGDNLDVLKLLQESYLNKIKLIYIDPPYNTGNDFIYQDDFVTFSNEYEIKKGLYDTDNNRLFQNTESNGRFHSDWCSMIYSRLMLARNLLTDDGVIFASIDDNEVTNLRKIFDELFGSENFIAQISVIVKPEGRRYGAFAKTHEYLLVYAKSYKNLSLNEIEVEGSEFKYHDDIGGFNLKGLRNRNVQAFNSLNRPNLRYPFYVDTSHPDSNGLYPVSTLAIDGYEIVNASTIQGLESVWRWGKEHSEKEKNNLVAYKGPDGNIRIFQKERKLTQTPKTVWSEKDIISNKGTKELQDLLGKGVFEFPKPVALLSQIISIGSNDGDIVMDFFAGSSTTAHALLKKNIEESTHRKFIMVQCPEVINSQCQAFKLGYRNICDIGKKRIIQASKELSANYNIGDQDLGFKVFKLASTNMKDVYYNVSEYNQEMLASLSSNIKDDRTDLDIFYGCVLEWGLMLHLPCKIEIIDDCRIIDYNGGDLIGCFFENISLDVIDYMATKHPLRIVFRDACFKDAPHKINIFEHIKNISPLTQIRVI